MRWIVGLVLVGLFGGQSAVIVRQHATLSSVTEQLVEREAAVRALQQRIQEFDMALAEGAAGRQAAEHDGQHRQSEHVLERDALENRLLRLEQELTAAHAERKRDAAALALAEKDMAAQREAAGKWEQELTLVRAELLWKKVGGAATAVTTVAESGAERAQRQPQKPSEKSPQNQPQKQAPHVVTAHSAIAAETPATSTERGEMSNAPIAAARMNAGVSGSTADAAQPKKAVRREARRIRKDAPADDGVFSFLP